MNEICEQNIKMVITDLDGTLLNTNREVSLEDMKSLYWLGENNIIRVIATGRNFFSLKKVLKDNFPIDYLIFSSGAGVYNWKKKSLMHSQNLPAYEVEQISKILIKNQVDFMIHEMIPENHKFLYHRSNHYNPDFERRINIYHEFAFELDANSEKFNHACQILAVFPNNIELFKNIEKQFDDIKIIRTTSPLDGDSIWMEIFPKTVSKGHGIQWLCNNISISSSKTLSIGNDFNDIDMLEFTSQKYVVANAPSELRERFPICASNDENGFSDVIHQHFDLI